MSVLGLGGQSGRYSALCSFFCRFNLTLCCDETFTRRRRADWRRTALGPGAFQSSLSDVLEAFDVTLYDVRSLCRRDRVTVNYLKMEHFGVSDAQKREVTLSFNKYCKMELGYIYFIF